MMTRHRGLRIGQVFHTSVRSMNRRVAAVASLWIAVAVAGLLACTSELLPMTWDEGALIARSASAWSWLARACCFESSRAVWTEDQIQEHWQYTTQIEGHPALSALVIGGGRWIVNRHWSPLDRARMGPIVVFAIAVGAAQYRLWMSYGPYVALAGSLGLLTIPRLFAHAHTAGIDGPLTGMWLICWSTFDWGRHSRVGWVVWSVLMGAVWSCKFTGCLIVVPYVVWSRLSPQSISGRRWLAGLCIASVMFVNFNPPLWHDPLFGAMRFLALNLRERALQGFDIPTLFFSEVYSLDRPLPWYNAGFWIVAVIPCGTLAAAVCGGWLVWKNRLVQPDGLLLLLQGLIVPLVRSTPWAPPHDAERLMLPSFAFLGLLSGIGLVWIARAMGAGLRHVDRCLNPTGKLSVIPWIRPVSMAIWVVGLASNLVWYCPCWLSHYSLCVGGLSGAAKLGLEPTYYWDAMQPRVWSWLSRHTGPQQWVYVADYPPHNLAWQRRWQTHAGRVRTDRPETCCWYVLQNRPGMFDAVERQLVAKCTPYYSVALSEPGSGWGPWKTDVPLLMVFSRRQFLSMSRRLL